MANLRAIHVLLVEDNPGDARLVKEALRSGPTQLTVMRDGEEALEFLKQEGPREAGDRPDLILLDLNMPRKSGFDVLGELKAHAALKHIPVIVLSGSDTEENVRRCYELNANCFVSKRAEWQSFLAAVKNIQQFWCGVANLPPRV